MKGWICSGCNTFWRDDNISGVEELEECLICNEPRSKGKEYVTIDKEQWKYTRKES